MRTKKRTQKEKYIFMLQLGARAKSEPTPFGQLLFLENEISYSIVATLHTVADYLNIQKSNPLLKITFKLDASEDRLPMLGNLIKMLDPYIIEESDLQKALKIFSKSRNDITHNMFSKYKDIKELDADSMLAIIWGDKLITLLDNFRGKLRSK